MTIASPTPTAAVPKDVGLPSEAELQRALNAGFRDGDEFDNAAALQAILSLIRPAFEAKEMHHASGERITRKDLNNAYREGSENGRLAAHLIDGVNSPLNACCYRDECRALLDRALSAEAKLAQAVEELSGLRQAILDAAVICDDDEKAGDRLDKLARAIRARSASARGETR